MNVAMSAFQVCLAVVIVFACTASTANRRAAANNLTTLEETALRAATESVAPSVVQIRTIGGLDAVDGTLLADGPTTGLIISPDGYILSSAFNFVQQPASILVTLPNCKQAPAELVATDHSGMLVLLKVAGAANLPVAAVAPTDEIRPGQWAVAIGRTFRADRVNVSVGIVSAVGRMFGKAIQTDADVSTACYGGPLVDVRGRVMGLIVPMAPQGASDVAGAEWYDSGIGFAIPLASIESAIERMKKGDDQRPGLLGIGMAAKNPHSSPAELAAVRPDSPAGKAGLKKGDRIVEVEGKPIKSQTDLRFALGPRYAGEELSFVVKRGDKHLERTLELIGELPPFRHAFLGILPMRTATPDADEESDETNKEADATTIGVTVRSVYSGSPAERAGILPADRIEQIAETKVESLADALDAMNNLAPGSDVTISIVRDGEAKEITITAARMPTALPDELSPAFESKAAAEGEKPAEVKQGETRDLKLPEFKNTCKVYVPTVRKADWPCAVLLFLHAPGEANADELIRQWKTICDRDGALLIAPAATDASRWERTELEYLRRLSERVITEYEVDPRRIVVYGQGGGGSMAWLLGLASRDLFRGVAVANAPLPRQIQVPPNEPAQRFTIFAAIPNAKDASAQMSQGLEKLSAAGYPVTTISTEDSAGRLTDAQREELARWIDTLDRF
jgi:serine protease Do